MSPVKTHSYIARRASKPVVLCIAGSDSSGLAGIQQDVKTCEALGVHAATAITAITAQNNQQLFSINPVAIDKLEQQIDAALALKPQLIKIGLLVNAEQVQLLVDKLSALSIPIVYDPVLATSSDGDTFDKSALSLLREKLLPLCTVLTPNIPEAEQILSQTITGPETQQAAAKSLAEGGAHWVVLKGGHLEGEQASDYCYNAALNFYVSQPREKTLHSRGTGCAFASAIASALALGYEVRDALVIAKMAIQQGLINARSVNDEKGAVAVSGFPSAYWPTYSTSVANQQVALNFLPCVDSARPELGLYPVVDSADWLEQLLPTGVSTAQLRVKNLTGQALADEIERAVAIAKTFDCRLFINDYWQLAIEKKAYGVHLGQEDLLTADLNAISQAGLRLGLSSHSHFEVARARAIQPSYIACGPTFATTTKAMPWVPHGLEGLQYWAGSLDYPLVSIAGIDEHNIKAVAATGVSGIAMITAITLDKDPRAKTRRLMQAIAEGRPL